MSVEKAIKGCLISPNVEDSNSELANIVDVLDKISWALIKLGINNAGTNMGAIEVLAMEVGKVADSISSVSHSLLMIADAIKSKR